jgi:syringate O-demethylase
MLNNEEAQPGNKVTFVWGEKPGTGSRPTVEPHVQCEIRATVAQVPFSKTAHDAYRNT